MYLIAALIAFFLLLILVGRMVDKEVLKPEDSALETLLYALCGVFIAIVLALMWPATMTGIAFYYLIKYLDLRSQKR